MNTLKHITCQKTTFLFGKRKAFFGKRKAFFEVRKGKFQVSKKFFRRANSDYIRMNPNRFWRLIWSRTDLGKRQVEGNYNSGYFLRSFE